MKPRALAIPKTTVEKIDRHENPADSAGKVFIHSLSNLLNEAKGRDLWTRRMDC
jgi:hypothetical protein